MRAVGALERVSMWIRVESVSREEVNIMLIYPSRFNEDFSFDDGEGRHTLGMVGTGPMNRLMILVKLDLLAGFRNPNDKRNVKMRAS